MHLLPFCCIFTFHFPAFEKCFWTNSKKNNRARAIWTEKREREKLELTVNRVCQVCVCVCSTIVIVVAVVVVAGCHGHIKRSNASNANKIETKVTAKSLCANTPIGLCKEFRAATSNSTSFVSKVDWMSEWNFFRLNSNCNCFLSSFLPVCECKIHRPAARSASSRRPVIWLFDCGSSAGGHSFHSALAYTVPSAYVHGTTDDDNDGHFQSNESKIANYRQLVLHSLSVERHRVQRTRSLSLYAPP